MVFPCSVCGRKFVSKESLAQHVSAKHKDNSNDNNDKNMKKYIILGLIGLIVTLSIVTALSYSQKPGDYDSFASCLTEKGVVVYGNDFCSYTGKQLNYFGKSEKELNYIKCTDNQKLCDSKGVKTTPTWEYEGEIYEGVQTFERLSAITGCEI